MTLQVIPTGDDPFYSQTTTLDGVPYILAFAYSQRRNIWYLSIATVEGVDIQNGAALVCEWDLTLKCADPRKPAGKLLVLTNSTDDSPPGLEDLAPGGRCILCYMPAADVAAGRAP